LALSNSKAEFRSGDKQANYQAQGKIFDESPHQNTVNGSLSGPPQLCAARSCKADLLVRLMTHDCRLKEQRVAKAKCRDRGHRRSQRVVLSRLLSIEIGYHPTVAITALCATNR
jgi:hypothetical protein